MIADFFLLTPQHLYASNPRFAYLYATLCFFGGIGLTYLFDRGLHLFEHWVGARRTKKQAKASATDSDQTPPSGAVIPTTREAVPSPDVEGQQTSPVVGTGVQTSAAPSHAGGDAAEANRDIDDDIGHDGHMVANIYENHGHSPKALIRMGIFAGIALAFHVS